MFLCVLEMGAKQSSEGRYKFIVYSSHQLKEDSTVSRAMAAFEPIEWPEYND